MSVLIVILLLHAAAAVLIVLTLGIKMRPEKQVIRSRSATTTDQNSGSEEKLKETTDGKEGSHATPASETSNAPAGDDKKGETTANQTLAVPPLEPIELRTEPLPLQPPPKEADPMPAAEDAAPASGIDSETLPESVSGSPQTESAVESGPGDSEPEIPRSEAVSSEVHGGTASPATSAPPQPPGPSSLSSAPSSTSTSWDAVTSVTPEAPVPQGIPSSSPASQPADDAGPITPASPMAGTSSTPAPTTTPPDADSPPGASSTTEPLSSAATPLRSPASGWTRSSVSPTTSQGQDGPSPDTTERAGGNQQQQTPQEPSPPSPRVDELRERIREQIPPVNSPAQSSSTQIGPSVPKAPGAAGSSPGAPPFFDLDAKPADEATTSQSFWDSKTEPATPESPPQTSEDLGAKLEALLKPKADPGRTREAAQRQGPSATSAYEAASRVEPVRKPVDNLIPEVIPRGVRISRWRGGMSLGIGRSITRLVLAIMLFSVILSLLAVLAVSWLGSIMRGIAG